MRLTAIRIDDAASPPRLQRTARLSSSARRGLAGATVVGFLGCAAGAALDPDVEVAVVFGGALVGAAVLWATTPHRTLDEGGQRDAPMNFDELPRDARRRALDLGWSGQAHRTAAPMEPDLATRLSSAGALAIGALVGAWLYMWICAAATAPATYESFEWMIFVQSLPVAAIWAGAALVAARAEDRRVEQAVDAFRARWQESAQSSEAAWCAQLAVSWVQAQLPGWVEQAQAATTNAGLSRLNLDPSTTETFVLVSAHDDYAKNSAMPTAHVELILIAVGSLLAIRRGVFLGVEATSYEVALKGTGLAVGERSPTEQEVHNRDVVTVEYQRSVPTGASPRNEGTFQVGLVNGRTFGAPTFEKGVSSCLETIRARTRATKAG
jgi:hypothetical protein